MSYMGVILFRWGSGGTAPIPCPPDVYRQANELTGAGFDFEVYHGTRTHFRIRDELGKVVADHCADDPGGNAEVERAAHGAINVAWNHWSRRSNNATATQHPPQTHAQLAANQRDRAARLLAELIGVDRLDQARFGKIEQTIECVTSAAVHEMTARFGGKP